MCKCCLPGHLLGHLLIHALCSLLLKVADDSNGAELSIFDPRAQPWIQVGTRRTWHGSRLLLFSFLAHDTHHRNAHVASSLVPSFTHDQCWGGDQLLSKLQRFEGGGKLVCISLEDALFGGPDVRRETWAEQEATRTNFLVNVDDDLSIERVFACACKHAQQHTPYSSNYSRAHTHARTHAHAVDGRHAWQRRCRPDAGQGCNGGGSGCAERAPHQHNGRPAADAR